MPSVIILNVLMLSFVANVVMLNFVEPTRSNLIKIYALMVNATNNNI
jgi:hypothetical protein